MIENPMVPAASATHIAVLNAANEVPPANSPGTGTAWILLDDQTNTLTWTVEYAGLSGPATGAHFHGPAQPGANADVIISLVTGDAIGQLGSPIQGTANITAEQVAQLNGGMWYVNIHTDAAPGGEIRGQVVAAGADTAAAAGPAATRQTAAGLVYVGPNGMTLYTFDNDTAGVTNCYGGCATAWPPFMAEAGAAATGEWTILPRTDGTQMWAYDGKPMYYFANDANPGDVNGNQPTGNWHVVIAD
jgi:predicted lipoprotein with Yx(FWY)xxD motif